MAACLESLSPFDVRERSGLLFHAVTILFWLGSHASLLVMGSQFPRPDSDTAWLTAWLTHYLRSLTMSALSSPFLYFFDLSFSFFERTTPFTLASGLVRFIHSASTTTARS